MTATSPANGTPVTRSTTTAAGFYAGAAVAAAVGIGMIASGTVLWGAVVLVVGAMLAFGGSAASYQANCPRCGDLLVGFSAGNVGPCSTCAHYSTWQAPANLLTLLQEDATSPKGFALNINDVVDGLPSLCCGCGARATRTELVSSIQNGVHVQVPHCDRCTGKAAEFGSGSLVGPGARTFGSLNVGSYRFYQATLATGGHKYFR